MNKEKLIQDMIAFIEEEEKNVQASKLSGESKAIRTDVVNNVLKKLNQEVSNEN